MAQLNLREQTLTVGDKDQDHEICIGVHGNIKAYSQEQWINKDQAVQIINHLKYQFEL